MIPDGSTKGPSEMAILITGVAGFIGYHSARRLLAEGASVVGLDNLNSYYDTRLKTDRLAMLAGQSGFRFHQVDLADRLAVENLFRIERPDRVLHLGAQAGVRHSLLAPHSYVDSNLVGYLNILEGCRKMGVEHLVYASSSSVYGGSEATPYSIRDTADRPLSLYAATKRANELMAHSYAHLFGCRTTG